MFVWDDTSSIVSGVIFMDMQFDGNYNNNTDGGSVWKNTAVGPGGGTGYIKDSTFIRCAMYHFTDSPIIIGNAWGTYLEWCIIEFCEASAIEIQKGTNAKILGCKMHNIGGPTIKLGDGVEGNDVSRIIIADNELDCDDSGEAVINLCGGASSSVQNCTIRGNLIQEVTTCE